MLSFTHIARLSHGSGTTPRFSRIEPSRSAEFMAKRLRRPRMQRAGTPQYVGHLRPGLLHDIGSSRGRSLKSKHLRTNGGRSDRPRKVFKMRDALRECDTKGGSNVKFESWKSSVADVRSTIAATKSYRCYFTEVDDRIRSYEQIECENDAAAALKAQGLLAASQFTSAEVWQGRRLVGKWDNTVAASPRSQTNADSST